MKEESKNITEEERALIIMMRSIKVQAHEVMRFVQEGLKRGGGKLRRAERCLELGEEGMKRNRQTVSFCTGGRSSSGGEKGETGAHAEWLSASDETTDARVSAGEVTTCAQHTQRGMRRMAGEGIYHTKPTQEGTRGAQQCIQHSQTSRLVLRKPDTQHPCASYPRKEHQHPQQRGTHTFNAHRRDIQWRLLSRSAGYHALRRSTPQRSGAAVLGRRAA